MKVFISSVYQDSREPGEERHLAIRRSLYEKGEARGHEMWVAEYTHKELTSSTPWQQIVDTCTAGVKDCDLFIALLFRRWGSPITIHSEGPTPTSFFEIELFHASLQQIPAFFIEAEGFKPEPDLRNVIDTVQSLSVSGQWIRRSEPEMEQAALDIIDAVSQGNSRSTPFTGFTDARSDELSFSKVGREIRSARLSFLGQFKPTSDRGSYSRGRVEALLAEARNTPMSGNAGYADKLSRLWMALRELAKLGDTDLEAEDIEASSTVASQWTSPAAWLQLHGPLRLGALAALQTRTDLARRHRSAGTVPYGAFASEAYSIGKVSHTRKWRIRRFKAAQVLASEQARRGGNDPTGAWLIRASATMQLALLGRPWLVLAAQGDYAAALRHRERHGAAPSAVGEAQVELGFAKFQVGRALFWQRNDGLRLMREGVMLMESDSPDRPAGFLKRGREKLALSLEAERLMDEARAQRLRMKPPAPADRVKSSAGEHSS